MDTTNILPLILPKMRKQMHTKGITSLDEIYMTIAGNAPPNPQSPIPNPQSPIPNYLKFELFIKN